VGKCKICNSSKGKRTCRQIDDLICSRCCGAKRKIESCSGCVYYSEKIRTYQDIPQFSTREMEKNIDLCAISNAIESGLCSFDMQKQETLDDAIAISILERLIDKYHFKDENIKFENADIKKGFEIVDDIIRDLDSIDVEMLVKVLGVIRFVAKRRTTGNREYFTIIHEFVGVHIGPGMRALKQANLEYCLNNTISVLL
jgi:hypothetical protein